MNIDYLKNTTFFENSLLDFTYFVLILIIGLLLKRLFINYISKSIFNYLTKDSDEENFSDFKNDFVFMNLRIVQWAKMATFFSHQLNCVYLVL